MYGRRLPWLIALILLTLACSLVKRATPTAQPATTEITPLSPETAETSSTPTTTSSDGGTATPTGVPPTPTGTKSPTPAPACTPPACAEGEMTYCPGECPQGCGTICVTPTPQPPAATPPTIISFTADRASIIQDDEVTVTWKATGGAGAGITWLGGAGVMDGVGSLAPNEGSVTIKPHLGPVVLMVRNAAGSVSKELELEIACRYAWVDELAAGHTGLCPLDATKTWAAQQSFEHGFMIWLESDQRIYVFFYAGQRYRNYPNSFVEGELESDPSIVPPTGLLQPVRGFGELWREDADVREGLGWALAPEAGYNTWMQGYQGLGMHNNVYWLRGLDGTIYQQAPMGSTWQVYTP